MQDDLIVHKFGPQPHSPLCILALQFAVVIVVLMVLQPPFVRYDGRPSVRTAVCIGGATTVMCYVVYNAKKTIDAENLTTTVRK